MEAIIMDENIELYKHIYQDAEMAKYTLTKLLEELKNKDNKIKGTVEEILKQYEYYFKESKNYLEEKDALLEENSLMAKMGASMGIKKEVKYDNSDSSIAELLIQGISMGSIDMEKKLKAYEKEAEKEQLKFAKDFLEFQEDSITGLKKFL